MCLSFHLDREPLAPSSLPHTCTSWAFAANPLEGGQPSDSGCPDLCPGPVGWATGLACTGGRAGPMGGSGPSSTPYSLARLYTPYSLARLYSCPGRLGEAGQEGAQACRVAGWPGLGMDSPQDMVPQGRRSRCPALRRLVPVGFGAEARTLFVLSGPLVRRRGAGAARGLPQKSPTVTVSRWHQGPPPRAWRGLTSLSGGQPPPPTIRGTRGVFLQEPTGRLAKRPQRPRGAQACLHGHLHWKRGLCPFIFKGKMAPGTFFFLT